MSKWVNKAVATTLERVEICEQRRVALDFAIQKVSKDYLVSGELKAAINTVRAALFADMIDAYQSLFMWSNLVSGPIQKEARRRAFKHFLDDTKMIMQYLDVDAQYPGMWQADEEEEFRAEIEALKGESENGRK